jgi:hypothetical protein
MARKLSQEDMISYGFSVRHWQMLEAGRPSTLFTLLRVCDAFSVTQNSSSPDSGIIFAGVKAIRTSLINRAS